MPDGRIAYVDFGNVAELSQTNKQTLIDAIVHAVNEDYEGMAEDFIKLVSLLTVACAVCGHSLRAFSTAMSLHESWCNNAQSGTACKAHQHGGLYTDDHCMFAQFARFA